MSDNSGFKQRPNKNLQPEQPNFQSNLEARNPNDIPATMIRDDKRENIAGQGHATRHQREMDINQHLDRGAIDAGAGGEMGTGADIDAAVLAATNLAGDSNGAELVTKLLIGFSCEDLPNMDTTSEIL